MIQRNYAVYDVFTDTALSGNPLAVVFDSQGLDAAAMQKIAREFNYSESVFVQPAANPAHSAAIRIFTPQYEMPFAGHPTVGAAVALAERGRTTDDTDTLLILEEQIGNVRCAVTRSHDAPSFAEFDLPQLSRQLKLDADDAMIAAALGLGPHEVGFENHRPGLWSAGVPYLTVPVAGLAAMARVQLDGPIWLGLSPLRDNGAPSSAYVYCRETIRHDSAFHARMFVPGPPVYEDPATGSAAAAFSGAIRHFDQLTDGNHTAWIEQGTEMGRPSRIRLDMEVKASDITSARIGGHAVKIAEGKLVF